ncbi:MAG: SDR family oxidoreductase [Pseudohongiellaceae bacterium]
MPITISIHYNPVDSDCEGLIIARPQNILIIGAGSAIARALSRRYAGRGCRLVLTGRDPEALQRQARDLTLRGAALADTILLDVNDSDQALQAVIDDARGRLGSIDAAVLCHGTLPDQTSIAHDPARVQDAIATNGLSTIRLLCHLVPVLRLQGNGTLAVITSVAGDRGRGSNYIYGSAKALVSTYLQGLRAELHPDGIHVMDIRPGFVDTPMTSQFRKGPLWSTPDRVARQIEQGIRRRRDILYTPGFWRLIMWVIRLIPEPVFKRSGL